MSNRLRTAIICVVTGVWAVNFIAQALTPMLTNGEATYTPAPELNVAFMAIIGILTASYKKDEDKKSTKGAPDE